MNDIWRDQITTESYRFCYLCVHSGLTHLFMDLSSIQADFDQSHAIWLKALYRYRDPELSAALEPEGWTIGQVYNHLITSTQRYHIKQVELCLANQSDQEQGKTEQGEAVFAANAFPPMRIHIPPSPQYTPEQPTGRAVLIAELEEIGMLMGMIIHQVKQAPTSGKMKHFTLGYLDASEWLQLIAMHWRHHLRQKARLDGLLPTQAQ